jgi:hypothetical protein
MKNRLPTILIGFCIPMIAILPMFPFYNRIEPFVLGFSFNYFWLFSWLFLTSLCLFIAFRLDPYNKESSMKEAKEALEDGKRRLQEKIETADKREQEV